MLISLIGFIFFTFDILLINADELCVARKAGLDQHNLYRFYHKVPALTEDSKLNEIAQKYAENLMENHNGNLVHSGDKRYGENLYSQWSSDPSEAKNWTKLTIAATDAWYHEICLYSDNNPGFSFQTGHYTQLVWAKTNKIGLGVAVKDGKVVVVANYEPPGNILGSFDNVHVPPTNCMAFKTNYCGIKKVTHPLPAECGDGFTPKGGDCNGGEMIGFIRLNIGLIILIGIMIKGML